MIIVTKVSASLQLYFITIIIIIIIIIWIPVLCPHWSHEDTRGGYSQDCVAGEVINYQHWVSTWRTGRCHYRGNVCRRLAQVSLPQTIRSYFTIHLFCQTLIHFHEWMDEQLNEWINECFSSSVQKMAEQLTCGSTLKLMSRVRPIVQPGVTVVTDDLVTKSRATNRQITPSYTPILSPSLFAPFTRSCCQCRLPHYISTTLQ